MRRSSTRDRWLPSGFSAALGLACAAVAAGILATWWLLPAYQPAVGGLQVAPNTALGLTLLGLAVWASTGGAGRTLGKGLAWVVVAIAVGTLLEYALQLGSVIDHWVVPGVGLRPSIQTAASLCAAGLAVALLDVAPHRRLHPSDGFAVLGIAIALLAVLGFAYGIGPLYETAPQVGMSLPTALLVVGNCTAVLFARPSHGWRALVTSRSLGGALMRGLLPTMLVLPSLLGWLLLVALPAPLDVRSHRVAMLMVGLTLVLVALLVAAAVLLDRLEAERRRADQAAEAARVERMAALEASNRHLHQLNEYKDRLLGILSHELRTPLNFIMGFASILEDEVHGPLNAQQRHAVGKILAGADRMTHLVGDLLDAAWIEAGKLALNRANVDFEGLAREVVEEMAPLAAAKHQALTADLHVPGPVWVDGQRMAQVLTNLLDNATKFTPEGGRIHVEAYVHGGSLVLSVRDNGRGIAPEHLSYVFERFTQVDMSNTRPQGGVGLGLVIARGLVEAHGGTLSVMSRLGVGSTFTVALPLRPAPLDAERRLPTGAE